jgi:hypothetical protein
MPIPAPRPPERNPRGAGGPIILVLILATVIGFLMHQPTIGFLVGLGLGLAIALLLWRGDRR